MALKQTINDREFLKFEQVGDKTAVNVNLLNQLVPETFDKIDLGYTDENLTTVTYSLNSEVVRTLTLDYTGTKLTSVTKS
jgi:hypothetical protein